MSLIFVFFLEKTDNTAWFNKCLSQLRHHVFLCRIWHLIGPSGIGKDQLHDLIEAIMRSFRDHDQTEYITEGL